LWNIGEENRGELADLENNHQNGGGSGGDHFKALYHHHTTTVLRPFFQDHRGEQVPEKNFWTLWCKGTLTEADTLTIRLGATPAALISATATSTILPIPQSTVISK